jgi:4-amino-4-deoxy-L-arabinose transferase-like glycosyltransferase
VLTFFVGLGHPSIADSDEAFYAQAAKEMLNRGDWLTPHYNGQYRFEKPILYYWLIAFGYRMAGISELMARLPSAFAGLLLVLTTFVCARQWYDQSTGMLAGAITATSFGYVAVARQALPDLTLACFITIAVWSALMGMAAPQPTHAQHGRRWWLALSGIALAGGFLTKGPVGLVLPALVVGPLALWRCVRPPIPAAKPLRQRLVALAGDVALLSLICVVLAAPWFAAMTQSHGMSYLDRFFIGENVQRFTTERYNAPRPLWYYLPVLLGGLLPWSPLMLLWWRSLTPIFRGVQRVNPTVFSLALWALAPLLFYSLSIGKQPRYILPILPPLAILIARPLLETLHRLPNSPVHFSRDRLLASGGLLSAGILLLLGIFIDRAKILLPNLPVITVQTTAWLIGISAIAVGLISVSSRQRLIPVSLVIAAVISTLGVHGTLLSQAQTEPVQQMANLVQGASLEPIPYGRYRVFVRNLLYYVGRPHVDLASRDQVNVFLNSTERVLCVLSEDDLAWARSEGADVYEIGRVSYLDTGGLTLRTLLFPDPKKDLLTVVLVSNQRPAEGSGMDGEIRAPYARDSR